MTVITALELDDLVATRLTPGEAYRAHHRFGARRDEANLFESPYASGHGLGEDDLPRRRRAERRALGGRLLQYANDERVRVAEQ